MYREMSELAFLRPVNEATEREAFIEALRAGRAYDPQFKYQDLQRAASIRSECDHHLTAEFEAEARTIVEAIHRDYGTEENYCTTVWGRQLESSEVDCACAVDLRTLQLPPPHRGAVVFFSAIVSVNSLNNRSCLGLELSGQMMVAFAANGGCSLQVLILKLRIISAAGTESLDESFTLRGFVDGPKEGEFRHLAIQSRTSERGGR